MTEQYWQTADGRRLAIGDMTEDHLRNVLRQLIREKRILPPVNLKSAMLASIEADVQDSDIDTRHQVEVAEKEAEEWENMSIESYHEWKVYIGK